MVSNKAMASLSSESFRILNSYNASDIRQTRTMDWVFNQNIDQGNGPPSEKSNLGYSNEVPVIVDQHLADKMIYHYVDVVKLVVDTITFALLDCSGLYFSSHATTLCIF